MFFFLIYCCWILPLFVSFLIFPFLHTFLFILINPFPCLILFHLWSSLQHPLFESFLLYAILFTLIIPSLVEFHHPILFCSSSSLCNTPFYFLWSSLFDAYYCFTSNLPFVTPFCSSFYHPLLKSYFIYSDQSFSMSSIVSSLIFPLLLLTFSFPIFPFQCAIFFILIIPFF